MIASGAAFDLEGMLGTMGRVTGILVFKRLTRGIFNLQRFSIVGLPPALR